MIPDNKIMNTQLIKASNDMVVTTICYGQQCLHSLEFSHQQYMALFLGTSIRNKICYLL